MCEASHTSLPLLRHLSQINDRSSSSFYTNSSVQVNTTCIEHINGCEFQPIKNLLPIKIRSTALCSPLVQIRSGAFMYSATAELTQFVQSQVRQRIDTQSQRVQLCQLPSDCLVLSAERSENVHIFFKSRDGELE